VTREIGIRPFRRICARRFSGVFEACSPPALALPHKGATRGEGIIKPSAPVFFCRFNGIGFKHQAEQARQGLYFFTWTSPQFWVSPGMMVHRPLPMEPKKRSE
jgi:hypothetical protein